MIARVRACVVVIALFALAGCRPSTPDTTPHFLIVRFTLVENFNRTLIEGVKVELTSPPDPTTLNRITFSLAPAVDGAVAIDGAIATFTPAEPLAPSTTYTVTISGTVRNLKGKALGKDVTFTFTTPAAPFDTVPPAGVFDLAASVLTFSSAQLRWTAPGDDGSKGTAAGYDLRTASGAACPLTLARFADAKAVPGLPAPRAAGSAESFTVSGLLQKTRYCFALRSRDEAGNLSELSNSAVAQTPDVTGPFAPVLKAGIVTAGTIEVQWTAVGDDGDVGTVATQELRYLSGTACPITAANFASGTKVVTGGPQAAGAAESATASGLASDRSHCFLLKVADAAGNASFSNALVVSTPDVTAPAAPNLTAPTVASTSVALAWTAVGDDGNSGTAKRQELRYLAGADCPIGAGNFATGTLVAGVGAPKAAGLGETATASGLAADATFCFALGVWDEADNAALSNAVTVHTPDVTAPSAAVLDTDVIGATSIQLVWTAVGDDGAAGTAAGHELRYRTGADCAAYNAGTFAAGTLLSGLGAPKTAGSSETFTASGLAADEDHCFILKVADNAGNASHSNVLARHTLDLVSPATPAISAANLTTTAVDVTWTAVGDNGMSKTVASHELRYATGAACATFSTATFASGTAVTLGAPKPPGDPETASLSALTADLDHCFLLKVSDEAAHAVFSNLLAVHTVDAVSPAKPVLGSSALTATSVTIGWTAVGDNGSSGAPVASHTLHYATGSDCATFSSSNLGTATVALGSPQAPGLAESAPLTGLTADLDHCFILEVNDELPAHATFSDKLAVHTLDEVAPATPVLASAITGFGTADITFTAPGDDANAGNATKYDLRYQKSTCPGDPATFDFAGATVVAGLAAPKPSSQAETIGLTGLDSATTYCFALRVEDEVPNFSLLSLVGFATPDPSAQIAAVRSAINAGASSPVALSSLPIQWATVTYTKAAVGGAALGAADGPGFFLQNTTAGPAILVALDPASFAGGVQKGDVVDLSATEGSWLACNAPPCTKNNSMYAVTAATGIKRGTGAPLPAPQDVSTLTTATWPLPIGAGPWSFEHRRVTLNTAGTLVGSPAAAGAGFQRIRVTTAGVTSADTNLQLRVPDALVNALGLQNDLRLKVNGAPMWRTDVEADFAAWVAADISVSPLIMATVPADGTLYLPTSTASISITFNQAMNPATLTAQTAPGPCAETVQVSGDPIFTDCIGFAVAQPAMAAGDTVATLAPLAGSFQPGTRYKARVVAPGATAAGLAAISSPAPRSLNGWVTAPADSPACTAPQVVISQVYGGGGNTGALYKNDFIEIHNRGSTAVNLAGWSVQYVSGGGTGTWSVTALSGTLQPGAFFLVQEAAGTGGTQNLPTPDVTGTIPMSGTDGKVALVSITTALSGACPSSASIVDLVGYGVASCSRGTPTTALSNPTAAIRNNLGCADTQSNYLDFNVAPAAPRNSSTVNTCSCGGGTSGPVNETDVAEEADYCALQVPGGGSSYVINLTVGATSELIYGQVFESGTTPSGGGNANIKGEIGFGPAGSNPFSQWVFFPAAYNPSCGGCGNNDEFLRTLTAPLVPGAYDFTYRFSLDGGTKWTWCDIGGAGSNPAQTFEREKLGSMTVSLPP